MPVLWHSVEVVTSSACTASLVVWLQTYMLCWTPWPLPAPELVNYGIGIDLLDAQAGCVLVATKGQTDLPVGDQNIKELIACTCAAPTGQ